jgi:hypothetical protein
MLGLQQQAQRFEHVALVVGDKDWKLLFTHKTG